MGRHLGVRYLYRELPKGSSGSGAALLPEALKTLSKSLHDELREALVRLAPGPITEVINRVSEQDARLAEVLARYAKRFAYTEILNALEHGNDRSREEVRDG